MKLFDNIRKYAAVAAGVMALCGLASCDSVIYDYEGDCDPYYKVRFVYDRNLKYTDAFAAEVDDVTLYVVDTATGKVVWSKNESGAALAAGDYRMDVDVDPGTYTLVAWCGKGHRTSFGVADTDEGDGLKCMLRDRGAHADGYAFEGSGVSKELGALYHGRLVAQEFTDEQGVHEYTVELTKNTNDVHIVLQHLSAQDVDGRFTFTIVEENGLMGWDNSLLPDEQLTYYPHSVRSGYAGLDVPDYRGDGQGNMAEDLAGRASSIKPVGVQIADFTVGRIMADRKCLVRIYNNDDRSLVASIPLVDYAVQTKGSKHSFLSDQDYLDYRDDYSLVLFLDENLNWSSADIYINAWKKTYQDAEL